MGDSMKKLFLLSALVLAAPCSFAQGYAGAVLALSRVADSCVAGLRCERNNPFGFKLFAGASLPVANQLVFSGARLTRVEVAAIQFGKVTSSGLIGKREFDADLDDYVTVFAPGQVVVQANAIATAAVTEFALNNQLNLVAKLGLAYVSATTSTERDDKRIDSSTKSSVQPYIGLGVEFALPFDVLLHGGVDWTRYRVDGRSGSATQLGVGAAISF
jgi:hypothetical protein